MSVWVTFSQIDKARAEKMLADILAGTFQRDMSERFKELQSELEKYPGQTNEEIYMAEENTLEAKAALEARLEKRREIVSEMEKIGPVLNDIKSINQYKEQEDSEAVKEYVAALVEHLTAATGKSFSENINDIEPYTSLLFKYSGIDRRVYDGALEKVPFDIWKKVFSGLNKEILVKIKNEIESNKKKWFEGAFETFVGVIKDIKNIFVSSDGQGVLFVVTVEGEGNTSYEKSLEQKLIAHLETNALAPVEVEEIPSFMFF